MTFDVPVLHEKFSVRCDYHTLECHRLFSFLKGSVQRFYDTFPLRRETAVRMFIIAIERCAFVVYIFVAVMCACPFAFAADFTERRSGKLFYPNYLTTDKFSSLTV